jgi:hypothetical protein
MKIHNNGVFTDKVKEYMMMAELKKENFKKEFYLMEMGKSYTLMEN